MMRNNEKTITEMTTLKSKLTITKLDYKLIKTLSWLLKRVFTFTIVIHDRETRFQKKTTFA